MSLTSKAVLGAIWSVSTSVGGRVLGLIGTLILTRFLAPSEYGVVSVAIVIVTVVNMASNLGFGQYIVASADSGREEIFHATVYHIGLGLLAVLGLVAAQDLLAALFEMPDLADYIPVLSIAIMCERIGYVPNRVLARDMRFDVLGVRQLAGEVVYATTAVYLAWRGLGAAAVMWAFFARMVIQSLVCIAKVPWRQWLTPTKLSRSKTKEMLDFGLPMTGANVMHFSSQRGDNLLIAGMFGSAAVGFYNFAYNIANIPATHVGEHIGDVLLPSFAKLDTVEEKHRALLRASGLLALVVFPLAVGLGAIAHTVVGVLLDPRWAPVAPMLLILSVLSVFRPVGWLIQAYLQAMKRTRTLMVLEGVKIAFLFGLIWLLGELGGVLWSCGAIGVAFLIFAVGCQWAVHREDGVGMWAMTRPYVRPLLACAPMVAAVLGVRQLMGVTTWWSLIVEIAVGAVAYVLSALVVAGPQARDFLRLVKKVLRRRKGESEQVDQAAGRYGREAVSGAQ